MKEAQQMEDQAHRAIAIVGLGAILPDAPDVPSFARSLTKLNSSGSKRRLVANACIRKPVASSPL